VIPRDNFSPEKDPLQMQLQVSESRSRRNESDETVR